MASQARNLDDWSTEQLRLLETICDDFESSWRSDQRPQIEQFLGRIDPDHEIVLFGELLGLELDYRRRAGDQPLLDEYLTRFSRHADTVRELFSAAQDTDSVSQSAGSTAPVGAADGAHWRDDLCSDTQSAERLPMVPGYEVLERLGRGGMGVVYRARQLPLDRIVALKMLLAGEFASLDDRRRFRKEAEAVACLQHSHVVQIFEVGDYNGQAYFAMEFVEGSHLGKRIGGKAQPPRDAAQLVETLARTMQHAHERGVVHRDLKPSNILLTREGAPKISDFGLAKRLTAEHQSLTAAIIGTPSYMAPEQATGTGIGIGPAADIYALGAILYELLTGRPPFLGETPWETTLQVLHDEPLPPARRRPGIPRDLETICLKCLRKSASHRYRDAAELGDDLRRFLDGRPVLARPVGWPVHLAKWVRRRPAVAGLLALVVVITIGALTGMSWRLHMERQARREAEGSRRLAFAQTRLALDAQARAETEAATARAINEFLRLDLLRQASPSQQPDRDLKLETVLDTASDRIAGRFNDQPVVEAAIRMTIGSTYLELGKYDQAVTHLTRAHALRQRWLGEDDMETLDCQTNLASAYRRLGRIAESQELLEQGFATARRVLGPDQAHVHGVANCLALVYSQQGRAAEAEQLYREALAARSRWLGPDHPDTLVSMCNYAEFLAGQGQHDRSLELCEKTLELRRRVLGDEHLDTLFSMNNLAGIYKGSGRLAEALPLYEEALRLRRKVLRGDHPDTLNSMNNLASLYDDLERNAEAESLYVEALAVRRRVLGGEHADTLISQNNLATFLRKTKRYDEAERLFLELLETQRRVLGGEHRLTLISMNNLAELYREQQRLDEAEQMYAQALDAFRRQFGEENRVTLVIMNNLALCHQRQKRYAEAQTIYEQVLEVRRRTLPADHPELLTSMNNLGKCYQATGQWDRAEPLLTQAFESRCRRLGHGHSSAIASLMALATCYESQRKFVDAEKMLLSSWDQLSGELDVRRQLANRLVRLYTAWDRPDEAQVWREKSPDKVAVTRE